MKEIKVNPLRGIIVVIFLTSAIFGVGARGNLFGNYSPAGDGIFTVSSGNREMILFIL
jgi:hypothetical protein